MKTCFKCGVEKELSEFYKHKKMADGRLGKCKTCTNIDVTSNREANIEYYRQYDRDRGVRQGPEYFTKYRADNPKKYKARNMVNNAIRDKKLFSQACETCGKTERIHAHHDDYNQPPKKTIHHPSNRSPKNASR